jgi:hypothetical protein
VSEPSEAVARARRRERVAGTLRRFANPVQSAGEARLAGGLSRPSGGRDDAVVPTQVEGGADGADDPGRLP